MAHGTMLPTFVRDLARRGSPVLLAALVLTSCAGGDDAADGGEEAQEIEEIVFLMDLPPESLTWTLELIGQCAGIFEDNGLEVEFQTAQGSAQAANTVIAGGALLTRPGDIAATTAMVEAEAPLLVVGTSEHISTIQIMSHEQNPLSTPEDFAGNEIGLPSIGGASEQTLDLILSEGGVDRADVPRQVVGLTPGTFELVADGRIAGYLVALDTALLLEGTREGAVVTNPGDFMPAGKMAYTAHRDSLDDPQRAEQIRRYFAALADAARYVAADEENGFEDTMACIDGDFNVPTLEDPEISRQTLSFYVESWMANGEENLMMPDVDAWEATYEAMVRADMVPDGWDPADGISQEFAPEPAQS